MEINHIDKLLRTVSPEIPEPSVWLKYLAPSLQSNWHTNFGPVNSLFEKRLTELYGREGECVVTASSATSALSACLISEAISGPVLCPAFTFQATAASILSANCQPIVVDVDPTTGVVSPETLEYSLKKTGARAAVVLAPYGRTINFHEHEDICRRLGALLVIDNAAGLGVPRRLSMFSGDGEVVMEVYSLHATKPFGIGEGGAIFTPKEKSLRLRAAMNFGLQTHVSEGNAQAPYWGINGKMSEVHAAIGLAVADNIASRVIARQKMAANWIEYLKNSPATIFNMDIETSPWQVFPILLQNENCVLKTIEKATRSGIELRRYYSPSLGACGGMKKLGICPNAEDLANRALALPVRSNMKIKDQVKLMQTTLSCISSVKDE